jgi:tRNA (pseudouridine54-N1)-methyltransferase
MRQFVVTGHDVPTTPEFSLDDLPGGAGRLDLLARCITSALVLSHGLREDVRVHLVLADAYTVTFDGSALRNFNPDERSTAARVRNALEEREEAIGHIPVETSPGVSLSRMGFEATIETATQKAETVVMLHEEGDPAVDVDPPIDPVFVLSDHHDFTDAEADFLDDVADRRLSLGPKAIHADHAIAVAHNFLDTDGYTTY